MWFWLKARIADVSSMIDGVERRKGMASACGWIALTLMAASFIPDLIVVMDFSQPYQVAQFSQDEFWFMEEIIELQRYLLAFDVAGIRGFGSPFAYGFPFWLLTAIVALPFHAHVLLLVLFLRLIFVAMKYVAFYIVYRRVLALTKRPLLSLLVLVLVLAVPAYVFDGKIIGPEYFIMLLVAAGWTALFGAGLAMQAFAAFCFVLAMVIKINVIPLGLIFIPVLYAKPKGARLRLLWAWVAGALLPALLFLVPDDPFKEILAINATHRVGYGLEYLSHWYSYNALEFDNMLKGGWSVDFIDGAFFAVFFTYAAARAYKWRKEKRRTKNAVIAHGTLILATFFIAVLACFLMSLNSLMHPWFVFAPFMLLLAAGCLLLGAGYDGTVLMIAFVLVYAVTFGDRYFARWEHRIDKFEYVAATENANAEVAKWISANCPKAREAVIDYNMLWPVFYNGHLNRMWTLIEVEDRRRAQADMNEMIDSVDLLLISSLRANTLLTGANQNVAVPGAIFGNFFPDAEPYFTRQQDFAHLSVYARPGVCKKPGK
ncbi:MAG: hypothetical protein AB7H77_03390 [Bdellovibrionales bacterium]